MNIPLIPQDKANHFAYGAAIAAVVSIIAGPVVGLSMACVFGALKELVDYISNKRAVRHGLPPSHGVEKADALWTAAGGLVIALPQLLPHVVR